MSSKLLLYGIFCQILFTGMLMAGNSVAQNKSVKEVYINIEARNATVLNIFRKIEQQTDFNFLYDRDFINQKVRIDLTGKLSINDILLEVSKEADLSFRQVNNTINVKTTKASTVKTSEKIEVSFQGITVTGKVTEFESNEGLPGVNVYLKGTTQGTITDIEGNYALEVPSTESVLVFSSVGYTMEEIVVGNQTVIDVSMVPDIKALEEIVVIGYGTQRKVDLTGSVGIATSEDILANPSFNALQGLKGKVSGVNIFSNSGSPTGSPRVMIRGISTINSSSDPLYVVDGVVMEDFRFLNPNDIERIEVLKDASATAIYGARGANGVILVTTKRGGKNEDVTVSYNGYVSVGKIRKKMDLLNAEEWLEVIERGYENAPKYRDYDPGMEPVLTRDDPNLFDAQGNPLYDTDWQDESTRTAFSQNHQLSIQQGGEKSSVGAFLNYSDNQGIMLNSWMKRVNGKFAFDADPKKWLSYGVNMMVNKTWENESEETGGHQMPRRTMIEMPPIFPVKFPDGSWSNSFSIEDNFGLEAMANPVHVLETQERLRERTQIFGNVYLTFHLLPGLDLKTQLGIDNHQREYKNYSPKDLINISAPNGWATIENNQTKYWQEETYLSYNKTLGDHRINSVLGLSWQARTYTWNYMRTEGFADDFFKFNNMGAATTPNPPSSGYDKWSMNSYFLRVGYTFKDKYLATVTARADGSSRFGENNKYGFFPSLGLGWILSNEDFMSSSAAIDQLKLRASYGITGNTEIGTYRSLATVGSGTVLINNSRETSSQINRLANPELEWEKTSQFDIGLNLGLFDSRVSMELDYYYKLTTDLLLDRPVPHTTGFNSVIDNIGSVSNQGIDFLLNTQNISGGELSWESTLNLNYNKNRIESLGENDEDIFPGPWWVSGSQIILRVGEPLSSFYGYRRLGTWGTDEADAAAQVGAVPGVAKRSTEREIIGKGMPDWTGSFINRFYYKNFDLTVDLQFVMGVDVLQQFFHSTEDRTGYANGLSTILYEGWTEQNQNTMVQQIRNAPLNGQNSEIDDHWVSNGSYLRGGLILLGYTFDAESLALKGIRDLRIYASVDNAFVIHSNDFKGYDPEATSWGGNQWGQNIFFFQYPKPRTYTLGLNVKF